MKGWLIALGILFLLGILPLGVSVIYNAGGAQVRLIAGPVKITLFPQPKKGKKGKKDRKQEESPNPQPAEEPKPEEQIPPPRAPRHSVASAAEPKEQKASGGSWTDFLPLVKLALNFLGDFRRKLRVKVLNLKLILAGDDPCDLAVNYGRAWAALGNLMPQLERFLVIQKRNVEVECDFTASETLVDARLDISITLGRILSLVVVYAIRGLKEFLTIQKKRKGGAAT